MYTRATYTLLACLLLAAAPVVAAPVVADAAGDTTIDDVTVAGSGLATVEDGTTFVWQDGTASVNVTVTTGSLPEPNHEVCVRAPGLDDGERELGCANERLDANTTTTVTVPVSGWPDDAVGRSVGLDVALSRPLTGAHVDDANVTVTVVQRDGQFDGDQLSNVRELDVGTALSSKDTDGDGLWDGQEVDDVGSSPLSKDTDDDGVRDAVEVDYGIDPTVADTDGDGLGDAAERNQHDTDPLARDTDDDGLPDGRELRDLESDPTVADTDDDGLDDAAERDAGTGLDDPDSDDDGLADGAEVNRYDTDPLAADTDADGIDDGRELRELGTNPRVAGADSDGDLLSDERERQLGTDPGRARSPWGYVLLLGAASVVVGAQAYRAGWRVRGDQRTVLGRRIRVPTVTRTEGRENPGGGSVSGRMAVADRTHGEDGEPPSDAPDSSESIGPSRSADPSRSPEQSRDAVEPTDAVSRTADAGRDLANATADDAGATTAEAAHADTGDDGDASEGQSLPDEAFLTDTDRVLGILREAGGNCRQQDVVAATGWSKSKVSRVLSKMADDGDVRKISLGRENVIMLPGEEPDAVRSALDDDRRSADSE